MAPVISNSLFTNDQDAFFLEGVDYKSDLQVVVRCRYGEFTPKWASVRYSQLELDIREYTINPDNSVVINAKMKLGEQTSKDNSTQPGYRSHVVESLWRTDPVVVREYDRLTSDLKTIPAIGKWYTKKITIQPEKTSDEAAARYKISYPDGQFDTVENIYGVLISNPNKARYIPMEGKKGSFKSFNSFDLQGKKNNKFYTFWNYYGDDNRSAMQGKEKVFKRLEKE